MLKKHLFTILFISWMVFVTLLSLFSFSDIDESKIWIPHMDKMVHFTFYGVMVILGTLFLKEKTKKSFQAKRDVKRMFLFALCYGIFIEVLQYLMPFDRAAEIWDVLANTLGAFFGVLLIKKYLSLTTTLK
ncbi:VanZ family protein [Croceitalea rosinachiae]|uniref:VanZ family protein n=1 Tax=Croceitalea rosinachiae TaxID=3075596 RepID=A0ABU3A663_9FLAO|nr:VanZ family protein [Croceitalea sp. F388]MDT0605666.1 VanZ family protein [Croceitalea sp. F388]